MLAAPVPAPPLLKPVINLYDSVNQPVDLTAGRWVNGQSFRPWPNTSGWADDPCVQRVTSDQQGGAPGLWTPYAGNGGLIAGTVDYKPPVFRIYDQHSTFGFEVADYAERAKILSDVAIYKQLEAEFWSGTLAQSSGLPNPYLTNPATVQNLSSFITGGVPSVRRGFEVMEQALADYGVGARGIIHCRPEALPRLAETIRRDGNVLLTGRDNVVVAGVGYPNTGPGGASPGYGNTWIYATGWVDARIDPARIFPNPDDYISYDDDGGIYGQDTAGFLAAAGRGDSAGFIGAAMDRDRNAVIVRAERFASAVFDPQCHFAIKVQLDT